jgi:small-conductance mechanosensitive channel
LVLFVLNAIIVEMGGGEDNMEIHTMQEIISEFLIRSRVFGMKFFVALLAFAAFLILGLILRWVLFFLSRNLKFKKSIFKFLGRVAFSVLSLTGLFFALGAVGFNVTVVVASLGLTGFAVGFALRDALSNILAGILIILYRPFQSGDQISATGFEGEIIDIDLRYTTIKSNNGKVLIPNSNMFTNPVVILKDNSKKDK